MIRETFSFPASLSEKLNEAVQAAKRHPRSTGQRAPGKADIVRAAVTAKLKGVAIALPTLRFPLLAVAPCGPFREAIEVAESYIPLNSEIQARLFAADGDVFVTARGDSMTGRGIIDGMDVLMTPLAENQLPRRGEVVLVQLVRDGEIYESTIKTWDGMEGNKPRLLDGHGKPIKLPTGTEKVIPIAVAKGVIGRL